MPSPLSSAAAISPATNVPWPSRVGERLPPTKLFASAIRPAKSGWPPSMPESTTPPSPAGAPAASGQASNAWILGEVPLRRRERIVGVNAAAGAAATSAAATGDEERGASAARRRRRQIPAQARRPRRRRRDSVPGWGVSGRGEVPSARDRAGAELVQTAAVLPLHLHAAPGEQPAATLHRRAPRPGDRDERRDLDADEACGGRSSASRSRLRRRERERDRPSAAGRHGATGVQGSGRTLLERGCPAGPCDARRADARRRGRAPGPADERQDPTVNQVERRPSAPRTSRRRNGRSTAARRASRPSADAPATRRRRLQVESRPRQLQRLREAAAPVNGTGPQSW